MSTFKSLTSQDVITAPFIVNKSFTFRGSASIAESGIVRYVGINASLGSTNDNTYSIYQPISASLIYNSVKQLYYTNYIPNPVSGTFTYLDIFGKVVDSNVYTNIYSRFDNYLNTTLSQSRYISMDTSSIDASLLGVISIPKKLFGDYINPNTFSFKIDTNNVGIYNLIDDGEGTLIISGSNTPVGLVNYPHGTIIIDNHAVENFDDFIAAFLTAPDTDVTCSYQSSITLYETQYKCTLRENEFNYSLNPTLFSGSNLNLNPLVFTGSFNVEGTALDFVTGSVWTPYVTTVGLYNENQELLAVAKLAQPLPTSRTTDMSILINLDK
jgi:hypothetical protein